ncbi:hypothetical protein N0V90_009297 [Kalmusia sp. IMI 367209]|nr:hypothetical protein N0V90_009297 [Kalmusia sp. IMI 367209]
MPSPDPRDPVLISGGGTGIGAETARAFAQAGASRIALLGRRPQPLADTKASLEQAYPGIEVFTASVDVTKAKEVNDAVEAFVPLNSGKKINVLVSNAGASGPMGAFLEVDGDEYMEGINANMAMAFNLARAFLRRAAPDGTVIDVNSTAAHANLFDGFASYSIAKWANYRLFDIVGFNNPGLAVYSIQPGVVDTDMNRKAGGVKAMNYEDHSFNVWLASPEARFLKGKFLFTNWDVDELKEQAKEIEETHKFNIELVGWPFGDASKAIPESSWGRAE